jgi:CheY-like chemotaxis protein
MSHELRTPLNSILGLSESLLEQLRDPLTEHQQHSLQVIESSGVHLLELINDILDLSKIEARKLDYYPQPVDVNILCRSSLAFVREQAIRKSIQLVYEEDDKSWLKIHADPRRLKQTLVNLLTNAVKFTPEHGRVTLEINTDIEQDLIQFSVIDTGIGIAENDLKKLFQPFTQVDGKLNRQFEGTGLGLSLVQKMTDLHGGSVEVESESGKGSRFTLNLPWGRLVLAQQEVIETGGELAVDDISESSNIPSGKSSEGGTVLLAEDNMANLLTIRDYLESHGYEVVTVSNGLEAIKKAEEIEPHLILMDIQMPVLDGLEAIRRLRANSSFDSTPIIALTALAMSGDRERCLDAGANEYMSKPVSLKMLIKTINDLLKSKSK